MVVRDRTELEIRTTCILSGRTWDAPVPDIVVSGRYKGQCPTRPARFPTLVVTYDNKSDIVSLPLTPSRTYKEIHVQQRSSNGRLLGRPRIYFTSIPEEGESFQDETESKGGSV